MLKFFEGETSRKRLAIMSEVEKNGNIEESYSYEERKIEWKIADFFSIADNKVIESPTFCFSNSSWYFRICPKYTDDPDGTLCHLLPSGVCGIYSTKPSDYSVKFDFGLKKLDNSVVELGSGIFEKDETYCAFFFKLSEVQKLKCEVASLYVLTFWCILKCERSPSYQPSLWKKPKPKKLIKLDTLSSNFKDLIANKESCDTTLLVRDKEYKVHRTVLIARSSVFAAMFLHDTLEKQTGMVNIPDCDPESFGEFLEFLYSGKFEKPSSRNALGLYETSDKYEVEELKTFCVEYLMENLSVENVCDVALLADKYEETNLLSAAQKFFHKNLDEILDTSEWDSLVKNNYRLSKKLLKGMSSKMQVAD